MYNITSGSLRTWTNIDIRYHAGVSNEMLVFLGDFFLHCEAWIGPGTPWGLWCENFKETFPEQYRSIDPWLWLQRAKVIIVNSVCTGNLDNLPSTCTLTIYKKSEKFAVRETSERKRERDNTWRTSIYAAPNAYSKNIRLSSRFHPTTTQRNINNSIFRWYVET